MLYFRPHNFVNQSDNLLLVGGSTHPGSGLPTIFASAKIAVDKIMEENSEI
jgi:phytoene desaturase